MHDPSLFRKNLQSNKEIKRHVKCIISTRSTLVADSQTRLSKNCFKTKNGALNIARKRFSIGLEIAFNHIYFIKSK
jgi:hypothetical protein